MLAIASALLFATLAAAAPAHTGSVSHVKRAEPQDVVRLFSRQNSMYLSRASQHGDREPRNDP